MLVLDPSICYRAKTDKNLLFVGVTSLVRLAKSTSGGRERGDDTNTSDSGRSCECVSEAIVVDEASS